MKILIIEDEPKTGMYLKRGLTEAGFMADVAADGKSCARYGVPESRPPSCF
jgi:two-component system copper resistance phosphate regulon response regulator CusR